MSDLSTHRHSLYPDGATDEHCTHIKHRTAAKCGTRPSSPFWASFACWFTVIIHILILFIISFLLPCLLPFFFLPFFCLSWPTCLHQAVNAHYVLLLPGASQREDFFPHLPFDLTPPGPPYHVVLALKGSLGKQWIDLHCLFIFTRRLICRSWMSAFYSAKLRQAPSPGYIMKCLKSLEY